MCKVIKSALSLLCVLALLLVQAPVSRLRAQAEDTGPELAETVPDEQRDLGLTGFTDEYELSDDDSPVDVIVLLKSNPAAVQVEGALDEGTIITQSTAERTVEDDHELFKYELSMLFGTDTRIRTASSPYEIIWEYRIALNGVSITLPSNKVAEVAAFNSVSTIYPDYKVELEPLPDEDPVTTQPAPGESRNPVGMRPGRETMRADILHDLDYRGEGVVVAVLDTGIYYQHEAFQGAFMTIAEMRARGVNVIEDDGLYIGGTCYFVGRNFFKGVNEKGLNDPSEIGMDIPIDVTPVRTTGTYHGTHVSGIIAGRDAGGSASVLGIAPEAKIFVYRMLEGTVGSTASALGDVIAAFEQTVIDKADIVNLSFGSTGQNTATAMMSVAVNNIMLANPNMVFVGAAGNSGSGSYTVSSPSTSSMMITAANIFIGANPATDTYYLNPSQWFVSASSSRGPTAGSYEIKPDIGAHGSSVFSTVPPWYTTTTAGYAGLSGTSMASPHIAAAAALLVEYSRRNGGQWDAGEIKSRLMNNAIQFGTNTGAYDSGAGYVDVYAAATAGAVVSAKYEKVTHGNETGVPFEDQSSYATMKTGSLSFGSINRSDNETMNETIQVSIANRSGASKTYTVEYGFTKNPGNAADLNLSTTGVQVGAGSLGQFNATMTIGSNAATGFYEGFVVVREAGEIVARLPFAAVVTESKTEQVSTEAQLRAAVAGAGVAPTIIVLLNDITLIQIQAALTIPGGAQITLRGSGGVMRTLTAGGNYNVINVGTAQLTLDNIGIKRVSGTTGRGILNEGKLTLINGVISGHKANQGGGVANTGRFVMEGGEISGNTAINTETVTGAGGGVANYSSSTFVMNGGAIKGNTSGGNGGGVYLWGTFTMVSGEISGNTSLSGNGGGGIGILSADLRAGRLSVGADAVFSENKAANARGRLAADDALYAEKIKCVKWTDPFIQGFNNYDIGYAVGTVITIRSLNFVLNGTAAEPTDPSSIEKIDVIANTPIRQAPGFPADPVREGYTFTGWYLDAGFSQAVSALTAMPNNDTTRLYARWTIIPPVPETTPSAGIYYAAQQLTGLVAGNYSFNGGAAVAVPGTTSNIQDAWLGTTLRIVKLGNGTTTSDSLPQNLSIPARPAAPNVTAIQPATDSAGGISGTTTLMEYRAGTTGAWTTCTEASTTGLTPGVYQVRLKATIGSFPGTHATVTITAPQGPVNPPPDGGGGGSGGGAGGGAPPPGPAGPGIDETDPDGTGPGATDPDGTDPDTTDPDENGPGTGQVTPEEVHNPFGDISENSWYIDDVLYVYSKGLMNGTGENLFSPDTNLDRAMIVAILYRYEGEPGADPQPGTRDSQFTDIVEGSWYYDAVIWAAENKIVMGYGDNRFGPMDNITRQDLALIIMRYADLKQLEIQPEKTYQGFSDDEQIATYARSAVIRCYEAGIINGKEGNSFDPAGNATRAEAAAMLHRFLTRV